MAKTDSTEAAQAKYDPAKYYDVNLTRVIDHEGFTLKPGPNPVNMSGDWCNAHSDAFDGARETSSPLVDVEVKPEVHETAN